MKKAVLIVMVLAASALWAQEPATRKPESFRNNLVERPNAPTWSDLYCAGFISRERFSMANYVIGGKTSPNVSRFITNDTVFLTGAPLQVGSKYSLIRRIKDPNHLESFSGQKSARERSGDDWVNTAFIRVTNVINGITVATIEASCQDAIIGDIAVPFVEKAAIPYSHSQKDFQIYGVPTSSVTGKIVDTLDNDYLVGTQSRVYVSIGANKGVHPGDYLRITRGNAWSELSPVESISAKADSMADEFKYRMPVPPRGIDEDMPRRGLGEVMVLDVHPETATGIVTLALEDIHVGDVIELESAPPAPPGRFRPHGDRQPLIHWIWEKDRNTADGARQPLIKWIWQRNKDKDITETPAANPGGTY
jgi:hypothetical protein